MRRDSALLLSVLDIIEEAPYDFSGKPVQVTVEEYSRDEIDYHVLLLREAGFIEAVENEGGRPEPTRMTWKGHEYFDKQGNTVLDSVAEMIPGFS